MDELGDAGTLIDGVADVSGGSEHFCAVGRDGRIACWGANSHGQLGDGTTIARRNAVTVTAGPTAGD
jgi:alpha-tubulin suppressor-like RCC1 family protein